MACVCLRDNSNHSMGNTVVPKEEKIKMVEDTLDKEILRLSKETLALLQKRKEFVDKHIPRLEQKIMVLEEKIAQGNS